MWKQSKEFDWLSAEKIVYLYERQDYPFNVSCDVFLCVLCVKVLGTLPQQAFTSGKRSLAIMVVCFCWKKSANMSSRCRSTLAHVPWLCSGVCWGGASLHEEPARGAVCESPCWMLHGPASDMWASLLSQSEERETVFHLFIFYYSTHLRNDCLTFMLLTETFRTN